MRKWLVVIVVCLGLGFWLGRYGQEELRELFTSSYPHEAYRSALAEAGLADAALGRQWERAAVASLAGAPPVAVPFSETGYLDPARPEAVAYRFRARVGQRLEVDVAAQPQAGLLFLDLFRVDPDPARPLVRVASADSGATTLVHELHRDADYVVRVQPELLRGGRYTLTVRAAPTLSFPVDGAGISNVGSFFGDARDSGRRDHHGIDIFAPRGTPVVAASAGHVTSVRATPVGGNVVWVRDEQRGQSIYYAHLDRQLVERGNLVRPGDTLGLVGNTGNARTTPPHLHFGIYRRGLGPIDPLPFVEPLRQASPIATLPTDDLGQWRRVAHPSARLRAAPDTGAAIVAELEHHHPVRVLGATSDWYRVVDAHGRPGFVAGRLTEVVRPLHTLTLGETAPLRDGPAERGIEIVRLPAGAVVEVLGRSGGHLYVRTGGRQAWMPTGASR